MWVCLSMASLCYESLTILIMYFSDGKAQCNNAVSAARYCTKRYLYINALSLT